MAGFRRIMMTMTVLAVANIPTPPSAAAVAHRQASAQERPSEEGSLECCPLPEWWNEVETDRWISTPSEFQALWLDKDLSDQQKAKAMFRAIEEFQVSDLDVAVPALTYYHSVDRDYPFLRELYEFGVAEYIDFDRSLDGYSGEYGDLSAGMVNRLARIYLGDDDPEEAVPILRYLIDERGHEVNDHLLQWASIHLGDALTRLGQDGEAVDVLLNGRTAYGGDWDARLEEQLARTKDAMGWRYHLHDTRLLRAGAVVLAFLGLALGVVFAMRSRAAEFRPFRSG